MRIKVRNISKQFGNKSVLSDVSLSVKKGEIFGLLGPSGAGKTTLINILTGQMKATGGQAEILNRPCAHLSAGEYEQMGMMQDTIGVYERLSLLDNLSLYARLKNIPVTQCGTVLEQVGLSDAAKQPVSAVSKGMRMRLLLARAIMAHPKVLFLDEPTTGLDPGSARGVHALIEAERDRGAAVFLTTHNMEEAAELCDRVALLNQGVIVTEGTPEEICLRYNHQKAIRLLLKDGRVLQLAGDASAAPVIAAALEHGELESIHSAEPNLETVFIELTGRRLQ